jgi:ABC-type branched-subunit amino acid transport system permease subunit
VDEPGSRPAFYALRSGGWRDYWTLLHPPYTAWHLSYVALGAAAAPAFDGGRLGATVLAFFLGVGLTAHALDELKGRPLATRIPERGLQAIAVIGLVGAVAIGVVGAVKVSSWLLAFVGFGAFIVIAYNSELFGGSFHTDLWFALAWGAFPALTGSFAQAETIRVPGVLVAIACMLLTAAQRTLSTPVRRLRRSVRTVQGEITFADGTTRTIDADYLRHTPERALRTLSLALPVLALGLVLLRLDWP